MGYDIKGQPVWVIEKESLISEWITNDNSQAIMCRCLKCEYPVSYFWGRTDFCPGCGRVMTQKALKELENRFICQGKTATNKSEDIL